MIYIYILFLLIVEINNECDKSIPIYKNDECLNVYCTEDEFKNGDCIINNSIIKTQWLNKLIFLGNNGIQIKMYTSVEMPNNDIFFIFSNYNQDYIYIYGLKSSGEVYFKDNEENLKIIQSNGELMYVSNSVGIIINNKPYILLCKFDYNNKCELIDYENNIINYEVLYKFLEYENDDDFDEYSEYFTIINLNQKSKFLLSYLESYFIDLSIINLQTEDLSSYDIIKNTKRGITTSSEQYYDIRCFITKEKIIECVIAQADKLVVEIYDESLDYKNRIELDNENVGDEILSAVNCIHLKNEIGVFAYYPHDTINIPCPLYVQINEL